MSIAIGAQIFELGVGLVRGKLSHDGIGRRFCFAVEGYFIAD